MVIPALAEENSLLATLSSLAENPAELLARMLVLVVVNHREDAAAEDMSGNLATLAALRKGADGCKSMNLAWVDAASPGRELPAKKGGVGLARRIGLDLSLERLAASPTDPLLVCLDADTLVRPDYLPSLLRYFDSSPCGGAILHFLHQPAASASGQAAIDCYELFLRSYVFGLRLAGSPYAFHSVGSAMACRASAYHKIGGMNSRAAGEDFYFLQQLARTTGIGQVTGTVVYPSSRASHRVPFGTGRSVSKMLDGGGETLPFYDARCFRLLGEWLDLVQGSREADGSELMKRAAHLSTYLAAYLETVGFPVVWDRLKRNNPDKQALMKAFHGWFDGLKSMKLIHHLSAGVFPRCRPDQAVAALLEWGGVEKQQGVAGQLELLRRLQLGDDYETTSVLF